MGEEQKEKIKIQNLTDKVQVEEGYPVDILDAFLDLRGQYNKIIKSDKYEINPNIIIFLPTYKVKNQTFKRREYLAEFKEYEEKLRIKKGIAQIKKLDLTVGNKKHIKNLTDKLEQEISLDILDVFLEDKELYKFIIHSKRYKIDANIINFLRTHKSDKKWYGKENFIEEYKDYLEKIGVKEQKQGEEIAETNNDTNSKHKRKIETLTSKINDYLPTDILEVFFMDKKLYNEIIHSDKYEVNVNIITFLDTFQSAKTRDNNKRAEYINKFNRYNKNRSQLRADYDKLKLILEDTQNGNLHWEKRKWKKTKWELHQVFATEFRNQQAVFSIVGTNKGDNKWGTHIELEMFGRNNIVSKRHEFYNLLYKAILADIRIQDEKIAKEKQEKKQKLQANTRHISSNDFVVRTNVFQCISEHHHLKEVLGIIHIVKPDGTTIEEKVTAAYCQECGCYFLMRSEYERVVKRGILLCHMIEKEEFYKHGLNYSHLAGESILMRNGYNVKANVGLTDIQRQTILANVMDNHILTASQIISYLQMFMAQKKGLSSYKMAVDKWDADLQFVRLYKEDNKRRVFISSITKTAYRKK